MNTYTVTDLRHKTSDVIAAATSLGYVHIIQNSKPKVAVVDSEYLASLQEAYEDYMDTLEFDRTVNLPTISLEDHLQEYDKKHPKK